MTVKWKPDGYSSVTPYLIVNGAAKALDFYKQAYGALERFRMPMPGGRIGHCEFTIGGAIVMMADEAPDMGATAPQPGVRPPAFLMIYVEDADAVFAKAIVAGAKEYRPMTTQFYGDRSGTVTDPFGHLWTISTHVEDVPAAEMEKRMAKMCGG
ncbi:MAG TPA: VOC family protein [Gemmataceae bacterium]|jgi:PhnB protein|nr:VOC family protein [Gemmataceae bacterium]